MHNESAFIKATNFYKATFLHYEDAIFNRDYESSPHGIVVHDISSINDFRAAMLALRRFLHNRTDRKSYFIVCDLSSIADASLTSSAIILDKMGANGFLLNKSIIDRTHSIIEDIEDVSKMPVMEYEGELVGTKLLELYYGQKCFITEEATFDLLPNCKNIGLISMEFPKRREHRNKFAHTVLLATAKRHIKLGTKHQPHIMAENFNTAMNPELINWILDRNHEALFNFCKSIVENGASVININIHNFHDKQDNHSLERENDLIKESLYKLLPRLSYELDVMVSLDIRQQDILQTALEAYPGRALINSVIHNNEDEVVKFMLARFYGAALVFMPIMRNEIPQMAEERCVITKEMLIHAREYGLKASDFILDPLMLAIKDNEICGREALRTLQLYKETFNQPTMLGLSNISYGKSEKSKLHQLFLPMALSHNLSLPLLNIFDQELIDSFNTSKSLLK